jgi:hypothetical protein
MLSVVASGMLLAGIASAMYVAQRAAQPNSISANTIEGGTAIADMVTELRSALSIRKRTANSIEFTVADRNLDAIPETIHYVWSGRAGDPLMRRYNGGSSVQVLEDVHDFSLSYAVERTGRAPRILLVVPDASSLSSQDQMRNAALLSSGFAVSAISASASQTALDARSATADVAYISETVLPSDLGAKLNGAPIGVVLEEGGLMDDLKLATASSAYVGSQIVITDSTHPITSGLPLATMDVSTASQMLTRPIGSFAPGIQMLAKQVGGGSDQPVLLVVEYGGQLLDGQPAAGRRVVLPWGESPFEFGSLTYDALLLVRRALEWAAGSYALVRVDVVLQVGSSERSRMESPIELLNQPRVPIR